MTFDYAAAAARYKFKLGPITGVCVARLMPYDNVSVEVMLKTLERDTGKPLTIGETEVIVAFEATRMNDNLFNLIVRRLFARVWQHEFNEGFMRDGVRILDPHVTTAAA